MEYTGKSKLQCLKPSDWWEDAVKVDSVGLQFVCDKVSRMTQFGLIPDDGVFLGRQRLR